jgi:hypothetical protein
MAIGPMVGEPEQLIEPARPVGVHTKGHAADILDGNLITPICCPHHNPLNDRFVF